MNTKILAIALLVPALASAQEPEINPNIMPVTMFGFCNKNGGAYLAERKQNYGELPLFISTGQSYIIDGEEMVDAPGVLTVLSNQDTGTVSIAMLYPDGVACEILTGINFEPQ